MFEIVAVNVPKQESLYGSRTQSIYTPVVDCGRIDLILQETPRFVEALDVTDVVSTYLFPVFVTDVDDELIARIP